MSKKQAIEQSHKRVRAKLTEIEDQKKTFHSAVENLVQNVNSISFQAEETANQLLRCKDYGKMLHIMRPVMTKLEENLYQLLIINYKLGTDDIEDAGSSDNETPSGSKAASPRTGRTDVSHAVSDQTCTASNTSLQSADHSLSQRSTITVEGIDKLSIKTHVPVDQPGSRNENHENCLAIQVSDMKLKKTDEQLSPKSINEESSPDTKTVVTVDVSSLRSQELDKNETKKQPCISEPSPQPKEVGEILNETKKQSCISEPSPQPKEVGEIQNVTKKQPCISEPSSQPTELENIQAETSNQPSSLPKEIGEIRSQSTMKDHSDITAHDVVGPEIYQKERNKIPANQSTGAHDKHSLSTDDSSIVTTNTRTSTRKKKSRIRDKKVAELLHGVDQILAEAQSPADVFVPAEPDYGLGPEICCMELTEGQNLEVFLTEILYPSYFWLQPRNPELDKLSDKLLEHNKTLKPTDWGFKLHCQPKPGMIVCCQFSQDKRWYRARILSVVFQQGQASSSVAFVIVFFMDFGNREKATVDKLRPLHPQFASLPCQAFPSALSEAGPPDGSKIWSEEIRTEFINFVNFILHTSPFTSTLVESDNCPIVFSTLLFKHEAQQAHEDGCVTTYSLSDVMINDQPSKAKKVPNSFLVEMYSEQMKGLSQIPLKHHLHEAELHKHQKPIIIKTSSKNEQVSKSLSADDDVHQITKENLAKLEEPEERKPSLDSDEWKTQVLDDKFEEELDAELEKASTKCMEDVKVPANSESQLSSQAHAVTGQKVSVKDSSKMMSEDKQKSSSEIARSNVTDSKASRDLSSGSTPLTAVSNNQDTPVKPNEVGSCEVDIKADNTTRFMDESFMSGTSSRSKKFEELGLPLRMPKSCQYAPAYNKVMEGELSPKHITSLSSLTPTENSSDQENKSNIDEKAKGIDKSFSDSLYDFDANNFETRGYTPCEVTIPNDSQIPFLMSHIGNPSKFFVHIVSEDAQKTLGNLKEELTKFYVTANKLMLKKFFDSREMQLKTLCCAQYSGDSDFYRAKIIGLQHTVRETLQAEKSPEPARKVSQVEVLYVDFGNEEWISVENVYPLPPKFADIPPQALCCTLAGIAPPHFEDPEGEGFKSTKPAWSLAACKSFNKLTGYDKQLFGHVIGFQPGDVVRVDEEHPLGMTVVDTTGTTDVVVAGELVRQGYARATDLAAVFCTNISLSEMETTEEGQQTTGIGNELAEWNPMAEDFLSERNSYQIDTDDPAVATLGYKPKDNERICHFFDTKGRCGRVNCPFEHVQRLSGDMITTDKKEVFCAYDPQHTVTSPEQGTWVIVEVTNVLNPSHFYVCFPFSSRPIDTIIKDECALLCDEGYEGSNSSILESLDCLMTAMGDHYRHYPHRDTDYTVYGEGEVVAALYTGDNNWNRARIINSDPDNHHVEVFYVDFGNKEWLPESRIRQMIPQFMQLPFQAVECFLPLELPDGVDSWNSEACRYMLDMVNGKLLFAEVLESGFNKTITLNLYDTSGEEEIFINQALIDNGFAQLPPQSKIPKPVVRNRRERRRNSSHSATSSGASSEKAPRMLPG